jgi:hypothetical protein
VHLRLPPAPPCQTTPSTISPRPWPPLTRYINIRTKCRMRSSHLLVQIRTHQFTVLRCTRYAGRRSDVRGPGQDAGSVARRGAGEERGQRDRVLPCGDHAPRRPRRVRDRGASCVLVVRVAASRPLPEALAS